MLASGPMSSSLQLGVFESMPTFGQSHGSPAPWPSPCLPAYAQSFHQLEKLAIEHGFDHFLLGDIPNLQVSTGLTGIHVTNFPEPVLTWLNKPGSHAVCPTLRKLSEIVVTFQFGKSPGSATCPKCKLEADLITQDGKPSMCIDWFQNGCLIPLTGRHGKKAFAIFATPQGKATADFGIIAQKAALLFDIFERRTGRQMVSGVANKLTARETECLQWVAAGKTSNEIALITGLSEHTVNHYLASACRKLDAVNRIQAAVKAVRAGLI